jgi:AcrR family transcriptional regulator
MPGSAETPRDRYRAHNRAEIKRVALLRLAEVGPSALTLTAVARSMGFSGPALYRYFANRDELLAELTADAHQDAASTVAGAAQASAGMTPRARLHAVSGAYRRWALSQPHRYQLTVGPLGAGSPSGPPPSAPTGSPPGARATAQSSALAAQQQIIATMAAVILPDLHREAAATSDPRYAQIDAALARWKTPPTPAGGRSGERRPEDGVRAAALRIALIAWVRLHGLIALEVHGRLHGLGVAPHTLFTVEIDALADSVGLRRGAGRPGRDPHLHTTDR